MKKKYKRGERQSLLRRFENQRIVIKGMKNEIESLNEKISALNRRISQLGTEVETIDEGAGPIQILRPEVYAYGLTAVLFEDPDKEVTDEIERKMAYKLAKGLIENNTVQFIYSKKSVFSPAEQETTVGAKLFVIPWDQMRTRKLELRRKINEKDKESETPACQVVQSETGTDRRLKEMDRRVQPYQVGQPGGRD